MRFWFLALLLVSLAFSSSILIVMDASGSMEDLLPSGEAKIDAAKDAANSFIQSSTSDEIAVMEFSGCSDTYDSPDPLRGDIRVIQGFTTDKSLLRQAVNSIEPYGDTPIAASLEEAVEYFRLQNRQNGIIILLTDGEETCGGDAEEAAALAYDQGYAVVNVIAYDLDEGALEDARRIATAGGGNVYTADNPEELQQAFTRAGSQSTYCIPIFVFALTGFLVLREKKASDKN
ncbi:MAG TPA: VWA domain-containing protein [Candidatus Bilamarchaeaceae archaeon]|nr:VWA domain-containing protein [Candidatus Bilamarchaeaceae archaeon]